MELHAHLNGSISTATMERLLKRHEESRKMEGREGDKDFVLPQLWQTTIANGERRTLGDCFIMFKMIHTLVNDDKAVQMVAHDVVTEFAEDGVVYLELRSTPRANPATNMTKQSYVDAVLTGIDEALSEITTTMYVSLLLSIDRRQMLSEAQDTIKLASEYQSQPKHHHRARVVGIDLSGDPMAGDMAILVPALKSVKESGLKLSMHIAERPDKNEETRLLLAAQPDRLGHGTFLHPSVGGSQDIVETVAANRIPIEMCLTSNIKGQTVSSYDNHHLAFWRDRDHPVIICTDDKGVFSTSLSEEYAIAGHTFSLSKEDLWGLSLSAVDYTFEEDSFKEELRKLWIKH